MSHGSSEHRGESSNTSWPTVWAVSDELPAIRNSALSRLLTRYQPVLHAHLVVKRRLTPDQANDLVQGFIQEKVLEKNLLRAADPSKGKFRTFLLTSFDRYVIDAWRKRSRERSDAEPLAPPSSDPGPDVFDVAWAMQVLVESLRRMRAECDRKQRADLWSIFEARTLAVLQGASPVPYQLLAERHGLASEKQAANRYLIAEAMFRRSFSDTLAEYADGDVEEEAQEFRTIFSQSGAELVEKLRGHLWDTLPELTISTHVENRLNCRLLAHLGTLPTTARDPGEMLRQFLAAPAPLDLCRTERESDRETVVGADSHRRPLQTFGDVLALPHPPIDHVELIKEFAKENRTDSESPLLREVATVLYYTSIAVALTRCGQRITRYDDEALRRGFQWGIDQPWVDESVREHLREGLQGVSKGPPSEG